MSTPPSWPPPPPSSPPPPPAPLPPARAGGPPPSGHLPAPKRSMSPIIIVVIVIAAVFGGIMVIGIIAAIAIPGLLRARMTGNEASAIGTMRMMSSAQAAWSASHDGRPALPSCLADPASCGDTQATRYLDAATASLATHNGYEFGFVLRPGADEPPQDAAGQASAAGDPTDAQVRAELEKFSTPDTGASPATPAGPGPSVRARRGGQPIGGGGFAYWASPTTFGSTGTRRFCVDETGVVREYGRDAVWTPPSDAEPRCPDTGRPLQ